MVCICAGSFPGKKIPLSFSLLDALTLNAGDLRLVVALQEDLFVMRIRESRLPSNQVEVGLQSFVPWRKELSAWNHCKQSKTNMVFTEDKDRRFFGFKIKKSDCRDGEDTVILSKGKFLNKIEDMYHIDPNKFWQILGGKRVFFTWVMDNGVPPETVGQISFASNRISCTNKSGSRVSEVGGLNRGTKWKLSADRVIALIEQGFRFHVEQPKGDTVRVVVAFRDGTSFLKTVADGDDPNNLLALPQCI
jgi:hypothetical protein